MADFVFSHCFDVGKCEISDKIDDKIAGVEGMPLSLFQNYSLKFLVLLRWDYTYNCGVSLEIII